MGEREDTPIREENGEIPYDPIYLTSHAIGQPNDASSSPRLRKWTFGIPTVLKQTKKQKRI